LRVEIVEEDKPRPSWWQRNGALVVGTILVAVLFAIATFLTAFPVREDLALKPPQSGLTVVLSRPPRLGLGDNGEISLEVTNRVITPLTGVRATLVFSEPLAVTMPITGSNVLNFETMEPGEGKRRSLVVQLAALQPVTFTVLVSNNVQKSASYPQEIPLAPLPYLRTLALYLIGAIGAWAPVTLFLQKAMEKAIERPT